MNHWAFVTAAYAVTLIGTIGLILWSYAAMRRDERAAERQRRDK